ncbi:hypothetical protein BAUCODRAFT_372182 [Baudoinia panamericana UAMH 10762]|uniref:Uncharacterized protein n=1 Tax=Baudoinia panamericana (strain UAMH 10762) TaxID=717646 RepID=M2LZX7_BAUPA|nr:uncharacterized protein BAUCODRAFT_372182 [Baudoinia panamericana UAMH 10762]EMD00278.1 hypothetical protein BAUCODRAFT_372182 [Baudoinia panamericana UAMH 10762]
MNIVSTRAITTISGFPSNLILPLQDDPLRKGSHMVEGKHTRVSSRRRTCLRVVQRSPAKQPREKAIYAVTGRMQSICGSRLAFSAPSVSASCSSTAASVTARTHSLPHSMPQPPPRKAATSFRR